MLNLAFIFHMHQPYYKNLLTRETDTPWVRLHGVKDYLDMVEILEKYPLIHQTFNLVPSLVEQVEDYAEGKVKDKFLELSYKAAADLSPQDKELILDNFFKINKDKVIAMHPRYFELYSKRQRGGNFTTQDYLDLQVWFNLAWVDPSFRLRYPELRKVVNKGRFFNEEDKAQVLDKQIEILKNIIPGYKKAILSGQIEVSISPYYHPILPLLCNTAIAKEANKKTVLPRNNFSYPQDAKEQINSAVKFYERRFGNIPAGMWPSEEAVSEHILPFIIESGINWIITDEAILFNSLKKKKRDVALLYQPHILKRKSGNLNIIFRDRNLSDMIGFTYYNQRPDDAVGDLMSHLKNIAEAFKDQDILVAIAMDGENAWEYYTNDGHDFLNLLYQKLSEATFLKCVTVKEYLKTHTPKLEIKRLAAGSWIYAEFLKWVGNPYKNKAWEYLLKARQELDKVLNSDKKDAITDKLPLIWKQIHIAEGSDWFWWYGEDNGDFDKLFRMHLSNFYTLLGEEIPEYLSHPLTP